MKAVNGSGKDGIVSSVGKRTRGYGLMKKKVRRSRTNSLPLMKELAWDEFSKYIRQKNADYFGICECITCGVKAHWKEMQAGHYRHNKLDFDEMNINVQCARCNKYLSGNLGKYSLALIRKHGVDKVIELDARADMTTYEKRSRLDFEEIYEKYKKLNEKFTPL